MIFNKCIIKIGVHIWTLKQPETLAKGHILPRTLKTVKMLIISGHVFITQ